MRRIGSSAVVFWPNAYATWPNSVVVGKMRHSASPSMPRMYASPTFTRW